MARARWAKGTPALFARANGSDGVNRVGCSQQACE